MNNRIIITSFLSALAFTGIASAQSGSGTMDVTATVQGSINLAFSTNTSGLALTGTASAAGLPFGTVNMYGGSVPTGVTRTLTGVASFSLATPFNVRVDSANSPSTSFTLAATLSVADPVNVWLLGGVDISAGTSTTITAAGAYAAVVPYTLNLTIPASETAGLITNTMNFVATAN